MSLFGVSPEKERELRERMASLGVTEDDLRETFTRSSGPGGQKVNKTSSCVHLVHTPTGLAVKCSRERSQALNRFLARRILLERLQRLRDGISRARRMEAEKIRRRKRRRSRRAKEKVLAMKHAQAEKKALRGRVKGDDE